MSLSKKPHIYGLDPFLVIDTIKANYYYGRTDVSPEPEEGQKEAAEDEAKDKDPELDPTLPWIIIMRGMYRFLYKKAEKQDAKEGKPPISPTKRVLVVNTEMWAKAFNMVTTSFIKSGHLKKPEFIKKQKTASGRIVELAFVSLGPGKGREKTDDYLRRRNETVNVLRRMEHHRRKLGKDPDVQKHLASLRDPVVSG